MCTAIHAKEHEKPETKHLGSSMPKSKKEKEQGWEAE